MTQVRYVSMAMPAVNLAGVVKGGKYWVSDDMIIGTPASWTGLVLDSDGMIVGAGNKGLSVWNSGVKKAQLNSDGLKLYGGLSVWYPDNWDQDTPSTWNGVVIGSSVINAYAAGVKTFEVTNTGYVYSYGGAFQALPAGYDPGNQATWTGVKINAAGLYAYNAGVLKASLANNGMMIYGGSSAWVPDNYDPGTPSTWNGVVINASGLAAYLAGVQTVLINNSGDFTFGSVTNKKISFTASTGVLDIGPLVTVTNGTTAGTIGKVATGASRAYLGLNSSGNAVLSISSSLITEAGSNPSNGVILDVNGLRGYAGGVQKFGINTGGTAFFSGTLTAATVNAGSTLTLATDDEYGATKLKFGTQTSIYQTGYVNSFEIVGYSSGDFIISGYSEVRIGTSGTGNPLRVYGTITAAALAGPLTGNVTGNVTGNCSGTAATVTGATQSSITAVGTLTSLWCGNIYPPTRNAHNLGSGYGTDYYWAGSYIKNMRCDNVYANTVYYVYVSAFGGTTWSDGFDDLQLLDDIKPDTDIYGNVKKAISGEVYMDWATYPDHVTNIGAISDELGMSIPEIKDVLRNKKSGYQRIEDQKKFRLDSLHGLMLGSIRQLNQKVDKSVEEITDSIKQLNQKLDAYIEGVRQ